MWQKKIFTPAAADVICSTIAISPWTPRAGRREPSGYYLSPENAIAFAAGKLAGAPAGYDVTALLVTGGTLPGFIAALSTLAGAFPLPAVEQVYRRARTALTLNESRMQIPALAGGLPAAAPLSVATMRRAAAATAVIGTGSPSLPDIDSALQAFRQQRAELLAAARQQLDEITAGAVGVYAVSASGLANALRAMKENIPHPDHVFSLCLIFAGADLAPLRGMLRDE